MVAQLRLVLVFVCLLSSMVVAPPAEAVSYIQDLNVSYEDGEWVCGGIECPVETYGCRVQRRNSVEDRKQLEIISTCFDEQKQNILGAASTFEMSKARKIDIDIESYIGAKSVYSSGYGLGGNEDAHGVVSPNDWAAFKESAVENKKKVEEYNAGSK